MTPLHKLASFFFPRVAIAAACAFSSRGAAQSEQIIRFDGGRDDRGLAITTDAAGAIVVAGMVDSLTQPVSFAVVKHNAAGQLQWMSRYQGVAGQVDGAAQGVAVDSAGNIYAVGYIARQPDFMTYHIDWLVVSFAPNGTQRWAHVYNSPGEGSDQANKVVVDSAAGALYVVGHAGAEGDVDWLTTKYSLNGAVVWQRSLAGVAGAFDQALAIKLDAAGRPLVLGYTSNLGPALARDLTLVQYDGVGNTRWSQSFTNTANSDEFPGGLAFDSGGNIFVTGTSADGISGESASRPFTLKYNSGGSLQYLIMRETAGGFSIAIGPDGNPVIAGTAVGEAGGSIHSSVSKIDVATGTQLWSTPLVTEGEVAIDIDGSIYVGGTRFIGTSSTPYDYFVTHVNSAGAKLWERAITEGDHANDAHLDATGNFLLTGGGPGTREDMITARFAEDFVPPPPGPLVPAAPTALALTAAKGKLTLRWTDNANNESGFRIERSVNGGSFAEIAQVGANATGFVNSGLNKRNTYTYRVRAFNSAGASAYSNTATGRPN